MDGQRLGSRWRWSIWDPRLISKGVFFSGVYIRALNVLCKCSNICFGFLYVGRDREMDHVILEVPRKAAKAAYIYMYLHMYVTYT